MKPRTRRTAKPIVEAATPASAACAPAGKHGEAPPEITVLAAASLAQALEGAELTEEAARDLRLAPGKRVYVAFKSHSLAAEPAAGGTNDQ